MYALCVSGAVNTQGFVWKFFYALYINFHSFIHSFMYFILFVWWTAEVKGRYDRVLDCFRSSESEFLQTHQLLSCPSEGV